MFYVYVVRNCVNGKEYVGITQNPDRRWYDHKKGRGSKLVAHAIVKYGDAAFTFVVIHTLADKDVAFQLERVEISLRHTFGDGYNLSEGGESGSHGMVWSEQSRQKVSDRLKANHPMRGKTHTPISRAAMSKSARARTDRNCKGADHPMHGKTGSMCHNSKTFYFDGLTFASGRDAANYYGVGMEAIYRCAKAGRTPRPRNLQTATLQSV
jgi:group I intron endonuclease